MSNSASNDLNDLKNENLELIENNSNEIITEVIPITVDPQVDNSKKGRVGGVILDGHKNLLIVYGKKSLKWGVPKGQLEEGETFLGGALREIKEETGLSLSPETTKNLIYWGVNRARLYVLQIENIKPNLKPRDTEEIGKAMWLNLNNSVKVAEIEASANKMLLAVLKKLCIIMNIKRE